MVSKQDLQRDYKVWSGDGDWLVHHYPSLEASNTGTKNGLHIYNISSRNWEIFENIVVDGVEERGE